MSGCASATFVICVRRFPTTVLRFVFFKQRNRGDEEGGNELLNNFLIGLIVLFDLFLFPPCSFPPFCFPDLRKTRGLANTVACVYLKAETFKTRTRGACRQACGLL